MYLLKEYKDRNSNIVPIQCKKSKLLKYDYKISSNNPEFLDIFDYNFIIETSIKTELPIKAIKLCFTNEVRNKTYSREKYVLSSEKRIDLKYTLMKNNNDDFLKLKSIWIEIDLEKPLIFEIIAECQPEKIIQVNKNKYDVIEFNYPKSITISNNQFCNFNVVVLKK